MYYLLYVFRAIAKSGASIVSPVPSMSAHLESYGEYLSHRDGPLDSHEYVSLYHDWCQEANTLLKFININMQWNIWTLVDYYNNVEKNIPL
jgi:hypothetical protein